MSWIRKVGYAESTGKLRQIYDRVKGKDGYIDNILTVHGARPHSLAGHMALYKNVLHHNGNKTPKWLLELLGVYVSLLNGCHYCVEHHFEGLRTLLQDDRSARGMRAALETGHLEECFHEKEIAMLRYGEKLTRDPAAMEERDVLALKEHGLTEGEILEVNQVVSYFAYANRTVLGLGVSTEGDILGLSPNDSDNPENWQHTQARD